MADISKITIDNTTYDVRDKRLSGIYSVIGTQTANTASWTGNIAVDALYDGLTIAYYLPRSSNGTNVSLNLTLKDGTTTTGAVNVYYTGTSRMGTQYAAGSTILLTYYSANSISADGTAITTASWRHADYTVTNTNTVPAAFTTGQGTSPEKTATFTGYKLRQYNYFTWVVDTPNSAVSALKLNVNGTGYIPLSINGMETSSYNYTLPAGTYIVYYNGYRYLVSTTSVAQMNVAYANSAGSAAIVNNHTVNSDVPADAVFTDTTYSLATATADGLMSDTDKVKLDGMEVATMAEIQTYIFS